MNTCTLLGRGKATFRPLCTEYEINIRTGAEREYSYRRVLAGKSTFYLLECGQHPSHSAVTSTYKYSERRDRAKHVQAGKEW